MSGIVIPVAAFNGKSELIPRNGIIVGGTWMLGEFLRDAAEAAGGQMAVAVPFVDEGIVELSLAWSELNHASIDLVLVTGDSGAPKAWREVRRYPWRSVLICQNRNLHAKLYLLISSDGHGSCLIGSHNLTSGGFKSNLEAGVLLRSGPSLTEIHMAVLACHQQVLDLAAKSKVFVDTTEWPDGKGTAATLREGDSHE